MQIKNNSFNEISIYTSTLTVHRLLPGINLLSNNAFEDLNTHPIVKTYVKIGVLELLKALDEDDLLVDVDTNLAVIDEGGELTPVTVTDGKDVISALNTARTFTLTDLKTSEIPRNIASKIINSQPKNGWNSAAQVIEALGIEEETEASEKINSLFE
jgi:hypothetical protein